MAGGRQVRLGLLAAALVVAGFGGTVHAAPGDKIFTVSNYPVEAKANDAVAARAKAVADGQKAALRSLMKRLVPVSAYARLRKLNVDGAPRMVDSLSVRTERNSQTVYSGSLDFNFQPKAVRALLEKEGLPFVDKQAGQIVVVPIWRAPAEATELPAALGPIEGPKAWTDAWKSLDLEHTLTPIKLDALKAGTHADTVKALANGDTQFWRTFAGGYTADKLVAAIAEPDASARRLNVTLIGEDAVGGINWKRVYRIDMTDASYAIELAGVVSLGVLEGRWKAVSSRAGGGFASFSEAASAGGPGAASGGGGSGGGDITMNVEFRGMEEWTQISRTLASTPGVENLDVLGMSGRGARVSLQFPGGPQQLAAALAQQGLSLRSTGGGWVLAGR